MKALSYLLTLSLAAQSQPVLHNEATPAYRDDRLGAILDVASFHNANGQENILIVGKNGLLQLSTDYQIRTFSDISLPEANNSVPNYKIWFRDAEHPMLVQAASPGSKSVVLFDLDGRVVWDTALLIPDDNDVDWSVECQFARNGTKSLLVCDDSSGSAILLDETGAIRMRKSWPTVTAPQFVFVEPWTSKEVPAVIVIGSRDALMGLDPNGGRVFEAEMPEQGGWIHTVLPLVPRGDIAEPELRVLVVLSAAATTRGEAPPNSGYIVTVLPPDAGIGRVQAESRVEKVPSEKLAEQFGLVRGVELHDSKSIAYRARSLVVTIPARDGVGQERARRVIVYDRVGEVTWQRDFVSTTPGPVRGDGAMWCGKLNGKESETMLIGWGTDLWAIEVSDILP